MGKAKAGARGTSTSPKPVAPVDEVTLETSKLKEEGDRLFGRKEYQKALDAYDRALKRSVPDGKEERALLHANKAACYLMFQRNKEAVNECTSALEAVPAYHKALVRRAKAYEQMGHYKQALSDIQKANKAETANPDTQETEKRLKDIVAGKRQAGPLAVANGAARKGPVGKQRQTMLVFTAKCELEDEVRVVHLVSHMGYAELLQQARAKFPGAPPFVIKYLDREGDLVTVTEKQDLQQAMAEVVEAAERSAPPGAARTLPLQHLITATPLRLKLIPVASEADVPPVPEDEAAQLTHMLEVRRQLEAQAVAAQRKETAAAAAAEPAPAEHYELDQWLLDFANLFREVLNVEPERHLDLTQIGWERLQAAMDTAVQDGRAPALFQAAADKFQEVSAHGMMQWGNVHICLGKRLADRAAAAGTSTADIAAAAEPEFKKAAGRFAEAARIKPDFVDGAASEANLEFERGKLAAGLVVPTPRPPAEEAAGSTEGASGKVGEVVPAKSGAAKEEKPAQSNEERQAAANAAQKEALLTALRRLTAKDMDAAEAHFDRAWKRFGEAEMLIPEADRGQPMKPIQEGAPVEPEEVNHWANVTVMWGNLLYEASQMRAAVGREWRPALDEAVAKFRAAGCPEPDIRQALANHTQAAHIDLPPLEPEKPAEKPVEKPAANGRPEGEEGPKGIPALPNKPKKKAASVPAPSTPAQDAAA
ncbi:hypothetical protein WJX81_004062 [Elliptochloris bilobata]|uniref:PB1 domain-containing protein n=1 Tax=Elliptochloris bilobata TaxID=381761 RepID=A0AAW1RLG5_9CHLO